MGVRHFQRMAREGVGGLRHLVAAQQVALHLALHASLRIVVVGHVYLRAAARYSDDLSRQLSPSGQRSVAGIEAAGEARASHEVVVVVVVLQVFSRSGRCLRGVLALRGGTAHTVVGVEGPLARAALHPVLRVGQTVLPVVFIRHVLCARVLPVGAEALLVVAELEGILVGARRTLVHGLEHEAQAAQVNKSPPWKRDATMAGKVKFSILVTT